MDAEPAYSGMKIFDESQFSNIKEIAVGGEGTVYQGTYGYYGAVAIKEMHNQMVGDNLKKKREIEYLLTHSFHPNIIRLLGIMEKTSGKMKKVSGIVMELMENGSLYNLIHNQAMKYDDGMACDWMCQASKALCYLHEAGIVHRDIKPKNLLLCDNYRKLKVGDFGLTRKISEEATSTLTAGVGTFFYISPEVLDRQVTENYRYTNKVDVYSFGISFWECLSRKQPYFHLNNKILSEILIKISKGERPILDVIQSEKLRNFLEQSWAQNGEFRPNMKNTVDFLERYMAENRTKSSPRREIHPMILERINSYIEEAVSTGSFDSLGLDIQKLIRSSDENGIISAENILDFREEKTKQGVDGLKLEDIFLIHCDNLLNQMRNSVQKLEPLAGQEPDPGTTCMKVLEDFALNYEPAVAKLKKRYLEESMGYSMGRKELYFFKLAAIEEQLKEFVNVLAEKGPKFAKLMDDQAKVLQLYIFEHDVGEKFSKEINEEVTEFMQTKGESLVTSYLTVAKILEEVIDVLQERGPETKEIIRSYKRIVSYSQCLQKMWDWGNEVDIFSTNLNNEILVKEGENFSNLSSNPSVLNWPKRKKELTDRFEELTMYLPMSVEVFNTFKEFIKNFPMVKKTKATENFNQFVKRNEFDYRIITTKLANIR